MPEDIPGTGLGCSGSASEWVALASEGGYASFAPDD
jgi:glucokinase